MRDTLKNIGLWIVVLLEYVCDVCKYGSRGAEERTLEQAIRLREKLQARIDKFEREREEK